MASYQLGLLGCVTFFLSKRSLTRIDFFIASIYIKSSIQNPIRAGDPVSVFIYERFS